MLDFMLWVIFGALSGWIGALATRTAERSHTPLYVTIGVAGALGGGFVTRNLGGQTDALAINANSLLIALMTSVVCILAIGFFAKTSPD